MGELSILGMGHFHPENVIDNAFLESLNIGTNDAWIQERVGILERRTVLPLDYIRETRNRDPRAAEEVVTHTSAQTGARAAEMALERAGLKPSDIGMVIAGGCCPDLAIPSEACCIAAELGISATSLDINSGCSSFGAQLHFLASMSGLPRHVLVVNPENTTRAVNYADRATSVLWGDGTSAAVVSTEVPSRVKVVSTTLASDPARWDAVRIPRFGHFAQDGNAVQRFAIKTSLSCLQAMVPEVKARVTETGGRLRFIGHQANRLMLEGVARRAELEPESHWHNVAKLGNTGAAGAPTVLSQHWDELEDGDSIVMVVVGAGLTWSSLRIDVG